MNNKKIAVLAAVALSSVIGTVAFAGAGEGSCGEKKVQKSAGDKADGKCGEGSCGEKKVKKAEGKCGEGSCGEKK